MNTLIRQFSDDPGVRLVAALILLSFVLGVSAAVVTSTFRLNWIADFLRRDVLGKVVPFFAVWAAVRLGGDIEIGGYGMIEEGVNGAVVLALGATILNSLRTLGLFKGLGDTFAGPTVKPPEPPPPTP